MNSTTPARDEMPVDRVESAAPPRSGRGHLVRNLTIAVGALVAAAAFVWWNAHRIADETLARHRATFEREKAALAGRVGSRPAVLEPFEDGTAEDVAARFESAVAAVPDAERRRLRTNVVDPKDRASPEEEDRILAAHPEPLAELAHILHRPSRVPLPSLDGLDQATNDRVAPSQASARFVSVAIVRAVERSDLRTALRRVGEMAALGADFERRGTIIANLVGNQVQRVALDRLRLALRAGRMAPDDVRTLSRVLDALDAARPPLSELLDAEIPRYRGLFSPAHMEDDPGLHNTGWRHLWSQKIYRAAALDEMDQHARVVRSIVAGAEGDWPKAIRDARAVTDHVENALAKMQFVLWPIAIGQAAKNRAIWRVARGALAIATFEGEHGGPPATLDALVPAYLARVPLDPWDGKPLRYAAGPPARVWSVGDDGKDDGGPPQDESEDAPDPVDVVVQVGPSK